MSARYRLLPVGVFDTVQGAPVVPRQPEWRDYEAWLTSGNVPDPMVAEVEPQPKFPAAASGAAREERVIARIATKDPIAALLRKAKL